MAFPQGWGRRCPLDLAQADGTLSDWTYVATELSLPAEIFTLALDGGGDIRFSLDQDGTTQLPCHVRYFSTSTNRADIAVKIPSLSGTGTTRIWVWYSMAGESQPSPSDPYGQHNSYDSNYLYVYSMSEDPLPAGGGEILDSTSNAFHLNSGSTLTSGDSVDGLNYKAVQFLRRGSDFLTSGTTINMTNGTAEAVFKTNNALTSNQHVFAEANFAGRVTGSEWRSRTSTVTGLSVATDTWYHGAMVHESTGNTLTAYLNGVSAPAGVSSVSTSELLIGSHPTVPGADGLNGLIDEVRLSSIIRESAWLNADYNNLVNAATFTTVGTPEAPPETVISTVTATNPAGSDVETFTWTEVPPP